MAASTRGCHLLLREQFSLAEPSPILEEPFVSSEVGGAFEAPPRQTLNANLAKKILSLMHTLLICHIDITIAIFWLISSVNALDLMGSSYHCIVACPHLGNDAGHGTATIATPHSHSGPAKYDVRFHSTQK